MDYLETEEDIVAYLEAALDEGDPALIAAALGDIARAKGMTTVAADAGLGRESLYKALSPDGNPEFATVLRVMRALGLRPARILGGYSMNTTALDQELLNEAVPRVDKQPDLRTDQGERPREYGGTT